MKVKCEYTSRGNYKGEKCIAQEFVHLKLLTNPTNPMRYSEAVNTENSFPVRDIRIIISVLFYMSFK